MLITYGCWESVNNSCGRKIMKKMLSIGLLIFAGLSGVAFGQTANDAIEAMQKVSSRNEIGISYKDYTVLLGEANYKVKPYLVNSDSDKNSKLKEAIQKAWYHYLKANQLWEYQFARQNDRITYMALDKKSNINRDAQVIDELIKLYPEMSSKIRDGRYIMMPDALSVIWRAATNELNFAVKLLALEENKKPTKPSESTKSVESTKSTGNIEARLDQIDQLKDKGKITDKEYRQLRKDILSEATKSK